MPPASTTPTALPMGTKVVVTAFVVSGLTHLARPEVFEPLVPRSLPSRRAIILGSGVAELTCAVGLLTRQRWAPAATAALLVGVWPGNWTMAMAWQQSARVHPAAKAAAWARLPVQIPLIRWAWRSPTR